MPIIWTEEKCLQEINKYEYKGDFMKKSPGAYAACKRNTWYLDKIQKLRVKLNRRWTKEAILELASKYKTRSDFFKEHVGAYQFALRRGWKEEIFKDIPTIKIYWNEKSCSKEAKKYNTKIEFLRGSSGAYMYASKNNILDKICRHMQVLGNEYKRMIYAYEFSDGYAYIGLTYNEKKRHYEHFYEKRGPVAKHICILSKKVDDLVVEDFVV